MKSAVSALQEFCAREKLNAPVYEFVNSEDGKSFVCSIELSNMEAQGYGRSKRDAKHMAAAAMIKKLRLDKHEIDPTPNASDDVIPTHDMIMALRDFCVQHDHPLPVIEIIQQSGSPDAPEFTAQVTLASIRRYGVSDKKKDAKQLAAMEMLRAIIDNNDLEQNFQVVTLDDKTQSLEEERYRKFKTYRELTDSKTGEEPGVRLCDRHNYFCKFYGNLRQEALKIINTEYESKQQQAHDVLRALKLTPKITEMKSLSSTQPNLFIELDCDYDAVFAGPKPEIYSSIINYFKDMLT